MTKYNYKAWDISPKDFPENAPVEKQIEFLLGFAVLAPSAHNSQPWSFDINNNRLLIKLDKNRSLLVGDPQERLLYIGLGCLLENLSIASDYYGFDCKIEHKFSTDASPLAFAITFTKTKPTVVNQKHLLFQISLRRTNRYKYQNRAIGLDILEKLKNLETEDIQIAFISDPNLKKEMAEIIDAAQVEVMESKSFREEISNYFKPNYTKEKFGMPGFTLDVPAPIAVIASGLVKSINLSKLAAKKDTRLLSEYTPTIGIISTTADFKIAWLRTGEIFQRLWLLATQEGLVCSYWAAPVQMQEYRKQIQKKIGTHLFPEIVFRIGYPKIHTKASPRFLAQDLLYTPKQLLLKEIDRPVSLEREVVDNLYVEYVQAGYGPPLVLLHGLNMGWGQWYKNIGPLSEHFTVYALSLPQNIEPTRLLNLVVNFLKQKNIATPVLIGHSLGAWIALQLVKQCSPSKLILVSPFGLNPNTPKKYRSLGFTFLARILSTTVMKAKPDTMQKFLESAFYKKENLTKAFINYYASIVMEPDGLHPFILINQLSGPFKIRPEYVIKKDLLQFTTPTLLLYGQNDTITPIAKRDINLAHNIPSLKIISFEHSGHLPFIEESEKFNQRIINFVYG